MLPPLEEKAVLLYREGKHLREVAEELGRSHEWVRKVLVKAHEPVRGRGREFSERPSCAVCGKPCAKSEAKYCSRDCSQKMRLDTAMKKVDLALEALQGGATYSEAAKRAGFKNGWHLWGRLNHFGMTKDLANPEDKPS